MNGIDREPIFKVLIPKGQNITPAISKLLADRGIEIGEERKNGSLHGSFKNFSGEWQRADSRNIIGEIVPARETNTQAGFVGSDFLADYMASLKEGESPSVVELLRFNLFDDRMRVSVVSRDDEDYHSPTDFRGRRFIGRYPSLMREFVRPYFPNKRIPVNIDTSITGGEEGYLRGRSADFAMVIVKTGGSLRTHSLKELTVVEEHIQPVFVANTQAIKEMELESSLDEFVDRLRNGKKGSRRWWPVATAVSLLAAVMAINPLSASK